jgi:hypothetical protein
MREISHIHDMELPKPMHSIRVTAPTPDRIAARMSRDELWHAVEVQSRVMGEAARRGLADDVYTALDVARAMTLAMYSTVEQP